MLIHNDLYKTIHLGRLKFYSPDLQRQVLLRIRFRLPPLEIEICF